MMKRLLTCLALALVVGVASAQDIPAGVRYHRASPEMNRMALSELKALFAKGTPEAGAAITVRGVLLGPGAWYDLQAKAPQVLLASKHVTYNIPDSSGVQTFEGRFAQKPNQQLAFWSAFFQHYHPSHSPLIRAATRTELQYYWAWIPFDIEEPLYIVEFGKYRFLMNFDDSSGKPQLFTVDRIPDMVR